MLRVIDLITPNETELRILMGLAPDDAASTRELAVELQKKFGITVIVTRGESGMMLVDDQGISEFDSVPVEVVDTTGAGDAFTAGLGRLARRRPRSSLRDQIRRLQWRTRLHQIWSDSLAGSQTRS